MIIADDIGASFNFGTVFVVELARVLAKLHGEATCVASESRALAPSQDGRAGRRVRSLRVRRATSVSQPSSRVRLPRCLHRGPAVGSQTVGRCGAEWTILKPVRGPGHGTYLQLLSDGSA